MAAELDGPEGVSKIGIVAHSDEGAGLCFLTACHEGAGQMGQAHMHPTILMSAIPMALGLAGWETSA